MISRHSYYSCYLLLLLLPILDTLIILNTLLFICRASEMRSFLVKPHCFSYALLHAAKPLRFPLYLLILLNRIRTAHLCGAIAS